MKKENITTKAVSVILILAIALLSMFVLSKPATSPETYSKTIQAIDDKKATVMTLTATAAAASTGLATIPGDVTTPVANQIMAISEYLFVVVCFLFLEKSLLTVMGFLSFKVLIPAACLLLILCVFVKKDILKMLAAKMIVFALVLVTIIPLSVKISDMIYEMNRDTVDVVITEVSEEDSEKDEGWLGSILNKIENTVSKAGEYSKKLLNKFVDAIALFVIVYCIIPVIVVFVVIWFIKFLFEVSIPVPKTSASLLKKTKKEDEQEALEV